MREYSIPEGKLLKTFEGHHDAIFSLAVSPDGKTLATGSYDQKIMLWNIADGKELKTLSGHNGAVFGLSFRPDGKVLASASSDRTVKLWDPDSGARLDTLSQSLKELYAVAFSPDGKRLAAAGADNRVRIWEVSPTARETPPPLVSRFAHEGAILRLAFSSDGKWILTSAQDLTVKLWDAANVDEKLLFEKQPDWPSAIAFGADDKSVLVGRLDGTLSFYDAMSGAAIKTTRAQAHEARAAGNPTGASKNQGPPDRPASGRLKLGAVGRRQNRGQTGFHEIQARRGLDRSRPSPQPSSRLLPSRGLEPERQKRLADSLGR